MTAPAVPGGRTIVESAIFQTVKLERDRYRELIVALRAEHTDNGSHYCAGDHAAMFVDHPCEIRDACDEALYPSGVTS